MVKKKQILLGLYILVSGIFASYYGGNISYALFYLSLAIPVVSVGYILYVYYRLKIYQTIGKRTVVKGEVTQYIFQLSNEDVISYANIKVDFYEDKSRIIGENMAKNYSLYPGETQVIEAAICCNYRGEYYVGAETVTISDFLYLFSMTFPVKAKMKVLVLPRVVSLPYISLISSSADSKRQRVKFREEEEPDLEVRKYINGDPIRRIHWKASGRKQELFTRKYSSISKTGVVVFMDLHRVKETELENVIIMDKILESTLTIGDYCRNKEIPCEIYYELEQIYHTTMESQREFEQFYQQCISIRFGAQKSIEQVVSMVGKEGRGITGENQVVIVTHFFTNQLYKVLAEFIQKGIQSSVIYIGQQVEEEQKKLKELTCKAGVFVLPLGYQDQIEDKLK